MEFKERLFSFGAFWVSLARCGFSHSEISSVNKDKVIKRPQRGYTHTYILQSSSAFNHMFTKQSVSFQSFSLYLIYFRSTSASWRYDSSSVSQIRSKKCHGEEHFWGNSLIKQSKPVIRLTLSSTWPTLFHANTIILTHICLPMHTVPSTISKLLALVKEPQMWKTSDRISFLEYFVCYFWTPRTWVVFIDRLNGCTSFANLFCLPCRAQIPKGQAYQGKWNCYFDFLLHLKAKNKTIFHSKCPVLRASEEVWVVIMFPRVLSQQAFAPLK